MLLAELLETPGLGLRVLHAPPGSLERPVGRTITIDLLEPGRFLTGGELVLTGLVWRRGPEDSETFVASIASRGAASLLAGAALLGGIPDDLVEACRRHDLALVEVPVDVPFADITEHVAAAGAAGASARLSASLVRQRQLLSAIASGRSLDELAARVSAEVGHACRVLTASGRHVVPGPGELEAATVDALTRCFLTADLLPAVAESAGTTYSLLSVGSGLADRLTGWALVVEGDHRTWPQDDLDAIHELGAIAALDRSRRDEGLRVLRPLAAETLAQVEAGATPAELATRLRQTGLHPDRPLVLAVAELAGGGSAEVAAAVLEDVALGVGASVVATARDGSVVAFLPAGPGLTEQLRRSLTRLAPGLHRGSLSVGLSGESGLEALAGALEEARFAHRVARSGGGAVALVGSEEVTSHVLLLATVPDDVRRTYAQRVLGQVLDHDQRGGGELVATLAEFLACSGSWTRTAESLHLHVNTVRYRIARVEELTGRDLSTLEDRVDVFLALKSL
ncbi:PucR family transcriptional regulator [Nocardioides aromaticivorans]|uniref:PucR family transcriptional regulator n=1 Tax=Nocardioides aromaticivorans TaxID=200618 RepID=UPI001A8FB9F3|nr:PucR family transcriptional regulator [Nocardioides aromaticivorans]